MLRQAQPPVAIDARTRLGTRIRKHIPFYLFLLPAVIWFLMFQYYPMLGLQIAFKKYSFGAGIWGSPWVGFKHFQNFLFDRTFWNVVRNTLAISFSKLIINFPAPIILALMLNAIKARKFKRIVQTVSYLPHFISWVVVAGLIHRFFSPTIGLVNDLRLGMGLEPIYFLGIKSNFIPFMVLSDMWKGIGYGSIIYLAALSGIDPTLYEASSIDGANGARQLWHITLPGLKATIGIMFLMNVGGLFGVNFEQVLLLQQASTLDVSEVIDTFVMKRGLRMNQFDYATAVGLIRNVLSMILVVSMNYLSAKFTEVSLW